VSYGCVIVPLDFSTKPDYSCFLFYLSNRKRIYFCSIELLQISNCFVSRAFFMLVTSNFGNVSQFDGT
jgi:hypothetical protein